METPILSTRPITPENRFGASLNLIHAFKDHLLRTTRNGQQVRAKWEIEWQSADQSKKANVFLRESISYKVSVYFIILPQISCLGGYKSRDHANRIEADPGTMDSSYR